MPIKIMTEKLNEIADRGQEQIVGDRYLVLGEMKDGTHPHFPHLSLRMRSSLIVLLGNPIYQTLRRKLKPGGGVMLLDFAMHVRRKGHLERFTEARGTESEG